MNIDDLLCVGVDNILLSSTIGRNKTHPRRSSFSNYQWNRGELIKELDYFGVTIHSCQASKRWVIQRTIIVDLDRYSARMKRAKSNR
jgi:phosphoribosylformylglycinamidine cyclo-ligase